MCDKFSRRLGLPPPQVDQGQPPPPLPPPPMERERERGQFWQREQSGLDKCERFSAGHLE